jgi:hypothetical protein
MFDKIDPTKANQAARRPEIRGIAPPPQCRRVAAELQRSRCCTAHRGSIHSSK